MANWYDNVPVPVDANGREVPLDTEKLVYMGETRRVREIAYNAIAERWAVRLDWPGAARGLSDCTLPDSWEALEQDAKKDACEYFGCGDSSIYNKCSVCPAYDDDCGPAVAQDVVRRAKALAGVSDGE